MTARPVKDPIQIFEQHQLKGPNTCVAWGLEFLLKVHDRIREADYPYQAMSKNGQRYGFGPSEIADLKKTYHLTTVQSHDPANFNGLKDRILHDIPQGVYSIFTIPSEMFLDVEKNEIAMQCHVFTAAQEHGELVFLTKRFSDQKQVRMRFDQLADVHHTWNVLTTVLDNNRLPHFRSYLLNTLTSNPAPEEIPTN